MKLIALLLPFLLMGGINLKDKQETTNNNVSKEAVVANVEQEETTQAVKKPKMLNRSGNETFLSEAYPTGTTTEFRETYTVVSPNDERKVCHYWDVVQNYCFNKAFGLDPFYDMDQLERDGYTVLGIKIKYKARATKTNTKLRTRVMIAGIDFEPSSYTSIPKNQGLVEVEDDNYYSMDLNTLKYTLGSSLVVTIETNVGGLLEARVAYISDVRFEYICKKPTAIGAGTYANPYRIYNRYQLKAIENEMNAYYKLANDIYFKNDESWEPIKGVFNGKLDGAGCKLKKFNIYELYTSGDTINVGLFETIGTGVVQSIHFENSQIYVMVYNINPTICAGFVAGKQNGGSVVGCTVENSYISVASPISYVGSIVGRSQGEIVYCQMSNSGAYGKNIVGGIVGMIEGTTISYSTISSSWIELEAGDNSNLIYAAGGIAGYMLNCQYGDHLNMNNVDYVIHGESVCNPAAGYAVGFLNNSNLYNLSGRALTHNSFPSSYFFAFGGGVVGRTEGSCFVQI